MERTERYNYVFDQYDGDSFIYDLEEDKRIEDLSECADILNKKEKEIERWVYHKKVDAQINRELIDEIEELKSRLSNCIEPKFKVGQEVWYIKPSFLNPEKSNIDYIIIYENTKFYALTNGFEYRDDMVFATEEEAKKHLEELKNG